MNKKIFLAQILGFFIALSAVAEGTNDPLPDYVAQFNEADARIRAIDSKTSCTNYLIWIDQAIFAKEKLKMEEDIDPWLEELADSHPNNWRVLHASAYGMIFGARHDTERRRWSAVQLMDQAHGLLLAENPQHEDAACFYDDYICMLMETAEQYLLQLKTVGTPYAVWNDQRKSLVKKHNDDPANDLLFFDLPSSYDTAVSDGELIRWLLHIKPEIKSDTIGLTLPDFAVLTAGAHINVPLQHRPHVDGYDNEPPPTVRGILADLKDDQTIDWGNNSNEYRIVELPEDYRYIAAFQQRAAQDDKTAAETLGNIFVNRCQMERAAQWFDKAGCTNEVREIRSDQGMFLPHGANLCGLPANVDFFFRNGSKVQFEIRPIRAGSNLLARLISKQVNGSEMSLLCSEPEDFQKFHGTDYAGLLGDPIHQWTQPLSPLPDHRDAKLTVELPQLEPGNYLLRATMKDGNQNETILHFYDTVLYRVPYYDPEAHSWENTDDDRFHILCDALTGKPKGDQEVHACDLSGGFRYEEGEKKERQHALDRYIRFTTGSDGIFISDDIDTCWNAITLPPDQPPFVTGVGALSINTYLDDKYQKQDETTFMTTDRPVYRPGDTGHLKLWHNQWAEDDRHVPTISVSACNRNYKLPVTLNSATNEWGEEVLDEFGGADFSFTIPENAPLGAYRCRANTYSSYYSYNEDFRVEEYRAPEFRVDAQLESDHILFAANYTYGKPLTAGSIEGTARFEESHTHWFYPPASLDAAWGKGYWWNGEQFSSEKTIDYRNRIHCYTTFTNNLDETGQTQINLSTVSNALKAIDRPGYFSVNMTAIDPAGKQLSDYLIVPTTSARGPELCVWLDKAFYTTNETITCHSATGNSKESLLLEITALSGTNATPLRSISLAQSDTTLPRLTSGTYTIRLINAAGEVSQPFEFAVLGDQAPNNLSEEDPIRLVLEKGLYTTNDTARILIQVDRPGRYVYWFPRAIDKLGFMRPQVFKMDTASKVVELPLDLPEDAGIIQSAAFTIVNGEPHLDTCTIPIQFAGLGAGNLELSPDKKEYKPGEEVSVAILAMDSDGKGSPCSITLTVYNKSLDLWAPPNPPRIVDALFSLWHNCTHQTVETEKYHIPLIQALHPAWIMAPILPCGNAPVFKGFGFYEFSEMSLFGCDASIDEYDPLDEKTGDHESRIRKDFRDLAYWNATIETDSNGCANVSFPMPDGLVEWKIKAWAMRYDYAAEAETSIRCAKDFVAQLNTPRFMVEGDELEISTSVRNHTTNTIDCVARCIVDSDSLQVESSAESRIENLASGREALVYWNTRAVAPGNIDITATVVGTHESDGMKTLLPILPHGLLKHGGCGGVLSGNWLTQTVEIVIPESIDPESLHFQLHTTPDLLEELTGALPFLADYPYGCTEQTLNRFLPSLAVLQTMQELGSDSLTVATNMPPSRQAVLDPKEILKRAQTGIDRLEDARKIYSGWGWNMDNSSPTDRLITAWVARGLNNASYISELRVNKKDVEEPLDEILDAMERQLKEISNPTNNVEISNIDAFQAVVLSEIGTGIVKRYDHDNNRWLTDEENLSSLRAFMELRLDHADQLSLYGKILLANAYDLQDMEQQRDRLAAFVEQYLEHDPKTGRYWLRTRSDEYWYWYNDDIELHAWYLKLLNRTDPHGEKTAGIARYLMQNRVYGDHWKSTRDTAICIEALAEFAKNNHTDASEEAISITLNEQSIDDPCTAQLQPGTNQLQLISTDGNPIFYDATWQYYSKEDPITSEACDLVSISRQYFRVGNESNMLIQANEAVEASETIEVELAITASQPLEYLLAEDHKPAGFETLETSSGYDGGAYREFHDERVSFYLNRLRQGTTTLSYRMRPEHAGKVSALPATVELMYEPRQAANATERKVQIIRKP